MRESLRSIGYLLAVYLLCVTIVYGQAPTPTPAPTRPKAVITDQHGNPLPEEVPAGEAVYLSAAKAICGSAPDSVRWIVKPKARSDRSTTFENNRVLSIPLGRYSTEITVIQIVALDDVSEYAEITIKVNGDPLPGPLPPPPGPLPVPPGPTPPGPVPPAPDLASKYGLTKAIYAAALEIPITTTRRDECLAMAECFLAAKTIAVSVADRTPDQITKDFGNAVGTTPYLTIAQKTAWKPFAKVVNDALDRVANLPESDPQFLPQTREAYIVAIEECEAGCRAAALK